MSESVPVQASQEVDVTAATARFPYERIIAWAAGPLAIVAGYLGTQLTTHIGLFGSLGISKDQTARAIVTVGTFGIGALCTYLGHAKWLANLPKWWDYQAEAEKVAQEELNKPRRAKPVPPPPTVPPPPPPPKP